LQNQQRLEKGGHILYGSCGGDDQKGNYMSSISPEKLVDKSNGCASVGRRSERRCAVGDLAGAVGLGRPATWGEAYRQK